MVIEPNKPTFGLRLIAVIEAIKGFFGLLLAYGLYGIAHHYPSTFVHWMVKRFHLDDPAQEPNFIVGALEHPEQYSLGIWTLLALTYATLRFAESYGLWLARRWGEWIAIVSAALYIPFELYALLFGVTLGLVSLLVLNVAFVAYLGNLLVKTRRKRARAALETTGERAMETPAGGH
jgi:uncharacterized membrane protein (DUF2068 family)